MINVYYLLCLSWAGERGNAEPSLHSQCIPLIALQRYKYNMLATKFFGNYSGVILLNDVNVKYLFRLKVPKQTVMIPINIP